MKSSSFQKNKGKFKKEYHAETMVKMKLLKRQLLKYLKEKEEVLSDVIDKKL